MGYIFTHLDTLNCFGFLVLDDTLLNAGLLLRYDTLSCYGLLRLDGTLFIDGVLFNFGICMVSK